MKRFLIFATASLLLVLLVIVLIRQAGNAMASLQVGMVELHLPSGATAYLRRQSTFNKPADLYLSENPDYCAPYDHWHDYRFPQPIYGASDSPALLSTEGDTIVIHAAREPVFPWPFRIKTFQVAFRPISESDYAAYSNPAQSTLKLPSTLHRVDVPFGHNTCVL